MPRSSCAALPGRWLTTRKVRNVTPHSTGIATNSRRPMNRNIGERTSRANAPARAPIRDAGRGADAVLLIPAPCAVEADQEVETSSHRMFGLTAIAAIGVVRPGPCAPLATLYPEIGNRNG